MPSAESCAICECRRSVINNQIGTPEKRLAELHCLYVECAEDFETPADWESEESAQTNAPLNSDSYKETSTSRQKRSNQDEHVQDKEKCYYAYKIGSCCGQLRCAARNNSNSDNLSPDSNVTTTPSASTLADQNVPKTVTPKITPKITCEFENKTYQEGQKMFSNQTELSCHYCICTSAFKANKFGQGPDCAQVDCISVEMEQRLRAGCTPIYHQKGCCPIDYHCRKYNCISFPVLWWIISD